MTLPPVTRGTARAARGVPLLSWRAAVAFAVALIAVAGSSPTWTMAASTLVQNQMTRTAAMSSLQPGEGQGSDWCSKYGGSTGGPRYSLDEVYACGPKSAGSGSPFDSNGFQCTELAARFLWARYGLYVSNVLTGAAVVDRFHGQYPNIAAISNGTIGSAPNVGTVMSFSTESTFLDVGHAAVVRSSTVDGSGNGTIEILSQNVSGTYAVTAVSVAGWVVSPVFGFTHIKWLGLGAPALAPAVATVGSQQVVFWKGATNQDLYETWFNGKWNGPVDLTTSYFHGNFLLSSAPGVAVTSDGTQIVFWQGPSNHLIEAYWNGAWNGPIDVTTNYLGGSLPVWSAPGAAVTSDGTQIVFWQGPSNHLIEAWWSGHWNGPVDVTTADFAGGSTLSSAPSVALAKDGSQIVFWQGPSNHLIEAWWNGRWNGPVDVTTADFAGGFPLSSAPSVAVAPDGTQLVFWQQAGPPNHLIEASWKGSWTTPIDVTVSDFGGAGLLGSSPGAAVTPDGSAQIVFWRDPTNTIYEAWYTTTTPAHWNGPVTSGWS